MPRILVTESIAETGFPRALHFTGRNDLVGVDIVADQRHRQRGQDCKWLGHQIAPHSMVLRAMDSRGSATLPAMALATSEASMGLLAEAEGDVRVLAERLQGLLADVEDLL